MAGLARRGASPLASGRHATPLAAPRGERVRLADGRELAIRPVEPGDAPLLRAVFEQLSALTRYKRFLLELDHLSRQQLRYLTVVDHWDHEALLALDAASGAPVGVARYVRDARDRERAGAAVVVIDAWQRRGVGSVLLDHLAKSARAAASCTSSASRSCMTMPPPRSRPGPAR